MPADPKTEEIASTLRGMVEHETTQIDRRLTLLSQLQGFLFASLGFAWDKGSHLILILSVLGIVIALLVCLSVILSMIAFQRIRKTWLRQKPAKYAGPDIFGFYPDHAPWTVYIGVEVLIPIALAMAWIVVLFVKFRLPCQ